MKSLSKRVKIVCCDKKSVCMRSLSIQFSPLRLWQNEIWKQKAASPYYSSCDNLRPHSRRRRFLFWVPRRSWAFIYIQSAYFPSLSETTLFVSPRLAQKNGDEKISKRKQFILLILIQKFTWDAQCWWRYWRNKGQKPFFASPFPPFLDAKIWFPAKEYYCLQL